jgi:DNA polymerase-3 subunit gamma/tau
MEEQYLVMARRWRPRRFGELVGQEAIVKTLENAIRLNKIAHAFLFIGPRGTGKTSTARLLAMALNAPEHPDINADPDSEPCRSIFEGHCMDVIEIDGASNNSVDQIRSLREECQYTPTACRFKIYIIDEVHMLSQSAFNALLKTLEEPPAHVKFIFATTEAHKIAPTIISRCQRFEFRPITEATIVEKLRWIAQAENIRVEPLALEAIARIADGGMRDAQSIFEQMASFGGNGVTEGDVINAYGLIPAKEVAALIDCVENADYEGIIRRSEDFSHCNFWGILSDIGKQLHGRLRTLTDGSEIAQTLKFLDIMTAARDGIRGGYAPEVSFQLALFRAIEARQERSIDRIIALLRAMKGRLAAANGGKSGSSATEMAPEGGIWEDDAPTASAAAKGKLEESRDPAPKGMRDTANFLQLPTETREKLKNLFHIEE